jgi:hypothetical protein
VGNRVAELRAFAAVQEEPYVMPTDRQLVDGGRPDLAAAVRRHGGWVTCAREAGLVLSSIARPRSIYLTYCANIRPGTRMKPYRYWNEFENLRRELREFIREVSGEDDLRVVGGRATLPPTSELEKARRHDLIRAIRKHGGPEAVARRLDLRYRFRGSGYWREFANVAREVELLLDAFGGQRVMPPLAAIDALGSPGLRRAVNMHGGKYAVAQRMGLYIERKPNGFWCCAENRARETQEFIDAALPGARRMPGKRVMVLSGRGDLAQALERHNALDEVAVALGLEPRIRQQRKHCGKQSLCQCLSRSDGGDAAQYNAVSSSAEVDSGGS